MSSFDFSQSKVFDLILPGIVAGANLSGDLKDPSYSIPKVDISANLFFFAALLSLSQGTLLAIAGTYVTYMYFGLQVELPKSLLQLMCHLISDWLCLCKPSQWSEGGVPFLPQQK